MVYYGNNKGHEGDAVGSTKEATQIYKEYEPYKGYKEYKPYKSYKEYAPYKPYLSTIWCMTNLKLFLLQGIDDDNDNIQHAVLNLENTAVLLTLKKIRKKFFVFKAMG